MTENGNNLVMPVSPMYGGYGNGGLGFGNDGWLILLLLFAFGGWGGMGGFGMGGMMWPMMMGGMGAGFGIDYLYPWLNNSQHMSEGFQNQMLNDNLNSIRDGVAGLSNQLCNTGRDLQMGMSQGFANAETAANARQVANMQQNFGLQQAMSQGFSGVQLQQAQASGENRLAIAGLGSDIAREACANRTVDTQNTQAILNALNSGVQSIKDQICQDKIDAKNEKIVELQNRLNIAEQNAFNAQGFANEVDALYNRLKNCPVGTTPVYGNQPIFTCPQSYTPSCGCGM